MSHAGPDTDTRPAATPDAEAATPSDPSVRPVRRGLRERLRTTDLGVYGVVTLAVALAHGVWILGLTRLDPFITRSGMVTSVTPGYKFGDYTIDPNDGNTSQALARQALNQIFSGHVPWWNPHQGLGAPLIAEMQGAASFPLILLQALPAGFLIYQIALSLIAGLATARLVRVLGLSRLAATVAGVLFGLQGALVWLMNAPANPIPFLPLLLVGVEGIVANQRARLVASGAEPTVAGAIASDDAPAGGRRWGLLTVATAVWLMLAAGFPEGAFISAMFVTCWVLWRLVLARGFRLRFLATLVAGGVLGLLLSSPAVLGFVSYLHQADVGGHTGAFADARLPYYNVTDTVAPYSFGPIWTYAKASGSRGLIAAWSNIGGYLTVAVIFVAIIGFFGRRLITLRVICAGWIALALLKSYRIEPVSGLLNHLPGIKNTAVYRYDLPTITLAAAILVAFALDDLVRRREPLLVRGVAFVVSGVVSAGVLVQAYRFGAPLRDSVAAVPAAAGITHWFKASFLWAGVSLVLLAICVLLLLFRQKWAAAVMALVLVAEAGFFFAIPSLSSAKDYRVDTALSDFLHKQADLAKSGQDLGRMYAIGKAPYANYGSQYDVTFVNVIDSPIPKLWSQFVTQRLETVPPGTNTLLASRLVPYASTAPYYEGLLTNFANHIDGFRSAGVEYVLVPNGVALPDALATQLSPVTTTTLETVYRLKNTASYFGSLNRSCTLTPRSDTEVEANCSAADTLVRRELAYPGWTASVSGRSAEVGTYDTYFQSVKLPAGRSTIEFHYVPGSARVSSVLFVVGLVLWVALLGLAARGRIAGRRRYTPRRLRQDSTAEPVVG